MAVCCGARCIGADIAILDDIAVSRDEDYEPVSTEVIDDQATDRASVGPASRLQPLAARSVRAVEIDERDTAYPGCEVPSMSTGTVMTAVPTPARSSGDAPVMREVDRVRPGRGIRIEDRLPQRPAPESAVLLPRKSSASSAFPGRGSRAGRSGASSSSAFRAGDGSSCGGRYACNCGRPRPVHEQSTSLGSFRQRGC